MAERPVPEVMHQAGDRDAQHLLIRDLQLGLLALELARPLAREVADAERVLEAVVPGAREDPLHRPELADAAQPLELGRVDDLHAQRVERDRPVDHVGDDPRPRERPNHPRIQQHAAEREGL